MKKALLIGINYTGTDAELGGCHQDVDDMAVILSKHGYVCLVMKDAPGVPPQLLPTGENIRRELTLLVDESSPGDNIYVHYSGHGANIADNNGDEIDGQDECILPCDFATRTVIIDDEIKNLIYSVNPEAKIRMCFDCCHSGSGADLPYRYTGNKFVRESNTDNNNVNVVFISGCRDEECSADATFNGRRNGAMTHALINAINDDVSKQSWKKVVKYMHKQLAGKFRQIPQLSMCDMKIVDANFDLIC